MSHHLWLLGPATAPEGAGLRINCHRRLRGPYTGAGSLLRTLVPQVLEKAPDLVRAGAISILSMASELAGLVEAAPETLASVASPEERTRVYPALRTRRLAHGAIDFLIGCAAPGVMGPFRLTFTEVDQADPTDQELIALLLRRADADRIAVTVHTRREPTGELAAALAEYAVLTELEPELPRYDPRSLLELLDAYVEADGTSFDPAEAAAYEAADPEFRAALHDARAKVLQGREDWSLRLGAIPYHLEHGSDRLAAGQALLTALDYCLGMGFHHAIVDYGLRGRSLVDPTTETRTFWVLTGRAASALAFLGDTGGAEPLYADLRRRFTDPELQINNHYAMAMLYTRYQERERRDHDRARAEINVAITIAQLLPDPEQRAFMTVFAQNGLALIDMHVDDLEGALHIVQDGLERLNKELPEGKHRLHRSVLLYNQASLMARLGRSEEAYDAYTAVLAEDPNWQDYYFERADVLRAMGRPEAALGDYDAAYRVTPPFWELHYNRSDLRAAQGDLAGAIEDLERVVELEPDEAAPWPNLVSLLLEAGEVERARRRIADGLRHHPDSLELLCARAQLALEGGDVGAALRDLDAVLDADPGFVPALAVRAEIAFGLGDLDRAVQDLTRAIESAPEDPDLLFNRAQVLQSSGRPDAALGDYDRALGLPGADRNELLTARGQCVDELSRTAAP